MDKVEAGEIEAFINDQPRVRCVDCARTILRGERAHSAHAPAKGKRPRFAVYCQGCRNRLIAPPMSRGGL